MSIHTAQLEFEFAGAAPVAVPVSLPPRRSAVEARRRQCRGEISYHAGLAAETQVAADYERRGYPLLRRRWRGHSGEIDLVFRDGDGFVFVEVKASRSFDRALEHLRWRQIRRLQKCAEEFVGTQPLGALSAMRFDVALLDRHGMIRVIEKAFGP